MSGKAGPGARRRSRTSRSHRVARRHRQLVSTFGSIGVAAERQRYGRTVAMRYRRLLIERFLLRHLRPTPTRCLEVGPGAGRFTPFLARHARELVLLDLSRPMLLASRRTLRRTGPRRCRYDLLQGALESLPLRPDTFDRVVAFGVLPFVADEFPPVLRELGALLRGDGKLLFELHTPTQDTMSIFPASPAGARLILEHPSRYHLWNVIRRNYQPYDPPHLARFEFTWQRPEQLTRAVGEAGLTVEDMMAVGPNFANQPRLLTYLRRSPHAFSNVLRLEEETGRWPELFGAGGGLLVAVRRRPP